MTFLLILDFGVQVNSVERLDERNSSKVKDHMKCVVGVEEVLTPENSAHVLLPDHGC